MSVNAEFGGIAIVEPKCDAGYFELLAKQDVGKTQFGSFITQVPSAGRSLQGLLGYRRCFDFDLTNSAGQDYAVLRGDSQYAVGVLADGVSQSFFGDLAATHLSLFLVQFLWSQRENPPDTQKLEYHLKRLEKSVSDDVYQHAIPDNVPPMQHVALEKVKAKGSQTVFAGFILDNLRKTLAVYQCGDVRVVVHRAGNPPSTVNADPNGRWSTGGTSDLLLKSEAFSNVEAVFLATDGVPIAWDGEFLQGDSCRNAFQIMVEKEAAKDDCSFLAVRYPSPPSYPVVSKVEKAASNVTWVDGAGTKKQVGSVKQVKAAEPRSAPPPRLPNSDSSAAHSPALPESSHSQNERHSSRLGIFTSFCFGVLAGVIGAYSLSQKTVSLPQQINKSSDIQFTTHEINQLQVIRDFLDSLQPTSNSAMIRLVFLNLQGYQVEFSSSINGVLVPGPLKVGQSNIVSNEYSAFTYVKGLPAHGKAPVTIRVSDSKGTLLKSDVLGVEEQRVYTVTIRRPAP